MKSLGEKWVNRIFNEPYNDPTLLLLSTGDQYKPPALLERIPGELCKVAPKASYKIGRCRSFGHYQRNAARSVRLDG